MEKDILSRVIEAEKEIQERIGKEREKSLEWLKKVKEEVREGMEDEERKREAAFRVAVENAGIEAEKKSVRMIEEETVQAEKIAKLSDNDLKEFIRRRVFRVLSGE